MDISPEFVNTLWFLLILIGLGVALTWYVFHWREFDRGSGPSDAADPGPVRDETEEWRDWELTPR